MSVNDAWTGWFDAGLKLIETLSATQNGNPGKSSDAAARIETDSDNGQTYVKVPVPDTETVQRFVSVLSDLLQKNPRG